MCVGLIFVMAACCPEKTSQKPSNTLEVPIAPAETPTPDPDNAPDNAPKETRLALPISFEGSPLDEEEQSFALTWQAAPRSIELYDAAGGKGKPVGTRKVASGDELPWSSSRVVVTESRVVRAKKELLFHASPFDEEPSGSNPTLKLAKGDEVEILKYGGEGTCLVGVRGQVYDASCPSTEEFEGEGWSGKSAAAAAQWWVELEGEPQGWVEVDGERLVGKPVGQGLE